MIIYLKTIKELLTTSENKYALAVNKIMEENLGDKLMSHELKKKLSMLETEYDKMKNQLDIAQEQLNKTKTKKLKQKLQIKEAKIILKNEQLETARKVKVTAEKQLQTKNDKLEKAKQDLKWLRQLLRLDENTSLKATKI